MKIFKTLLNRELLLTWRVGYITNLIALFLVWFILLSLASSTQSTHHIFFSFLLVQFLSITISAPVLVEYDHHNNMLSSLAISGHSTLKIAIAKIIACWIINSAISLIFYASYVALTGEKINSIMYYYNILLTTALIITSIAFFVAILTANLTRNTPLILLIASPLYLAFLLYSYSISTFYTIDSTMIKYWLNIKILWSFCLIVVPSSIFACSYILSRIE